MQGVAFFALSYSVVPFVCRVSGWTSAPFSPSDRNWIEGYDEVIVEVKGGSVTINDSLWMFNSCRIKTLLVVWCNGEDGGKGEPSVKVKELHMSIFDD